MDVDICGEGNDDIFFADLRKQILLLTMDEEDGFLRRIPTTGTSNISPETGSMDCWKHIKTQSSLQTNGNVLGIPPLITVEPNMQNIWSWELPLKECKGTGVFIPLKPPRRKSKTGRTRSAMKS